MVEAGQVAARFLHYVSVLSLFGLALFPIYAYPSRAGAPPAWVCGWLPRMMFVALVTGLLSAAAWGLLTAANMTGTLSEAADWDALRSLFLETGFGQVWAVRLGLFAALLVLWYSRFVQHRDWMTVGFSTVLLASLASVGHTQAEHGASGFAHVAADAAHLLAAGAWLGALPALGHMLAAGRQSPRPEHDNEAATALVRFSGIGAVAVAVLIASGLVNTWFVLGSWAALRSTAYGNVLLVKIGLFAAMLALAALNRFVLVPHLLGEGRSGQAGDLVRRLRRSVVVEQALGALVILAVSVLGTMDPVNG
jgi:putative copper resistance protein D